MKYARFEQLVIGVGGLAILGTALLSLRVTFDPVELCAQIMLLGVLAAAVHWGRRGGFIAAAAASLIYVALRVPLVNQVGLTPDIAIMLVARIGAFGIVGILGGEVCGRIKYIFAKLEDSSAVDDWTGVYNGKYAARQIESAAGRCERYGEPFSLIVIELSGSLTSDLRPSRQRSLARSVANHIREDIRLVDEVARLVDGRFLVMLPHTPKSGGLVASDRVSAGVREVVGAREEAIRATVLGGNEDADAIAALLGEISPLDADQAESDEYSSSAESTRNPADRRTSAAPSASTLNMSTADAPEGSTKQ